MSERLNRHRLAWRLNGFPIYDDDDEIVGMVSEPEWTWDGLTDDERAWLNVEAAMLLTGHTERMTGDQALAFMLGEYGIACFHRWENDEPVSRRCLMCSAVEPLPGRVVEVDGRTMRVPDPPPSVLMVPRASVLSAALADPTATPEGPPVVDEYRWDGDRYVIASR